MTLYPGRWRSLLVALCSPACSCPAPGKSPHPAGRGWQNHALARFEGYSERAAESHAAKMREHVRRGGNLGLGLPPHVVALDVDTDLDGGADYSGPLACDAALDLLDDHPAQLSGKTSNGGADGRRVGVHVFGLVADRRPYGTHYGTIPVTVRGLGNQVAVAPSRHRTGLEYEWLRELPADPALMPAFDATWFRHVPKTRGAIPIERRRDEDEAAWRARVSAAWREELADPAARFEPGRRHEALLWCAWHRAREGASDADLWTLLRALAESKCTSEGRFGAPAGSRERRALEQEIGGIVRSCRRRLEGWAA